jgi:hypothetical protein
MTTIHGDRNRKTMGELVVEKEEEVIWFWGARIL